MTPNGAPAITTNGLSKRFGQRKAVDGLNITIPSGTIAGFVGPNGAGKTTTIRMLLGLVRPSEGGATILGRSLSDPQSYLPRVGALVDAPTFYPSLSGRTNLEVLAQLSGLPISRVADVLKTVELTDRAKDPAGRYSHGMKQRLGLAMALLPDPELLIVDEPANGLDPLGIIQLRDLLRRLRDQGKTIFMSSHLLGELEQIADWLVVLYEGRSLFCGPASDLLKHRRELVADADDSTQLELVASIARDAGYSVSREGLSLRIACPIDFAQELDRRVRQAGGTGAVIHVREASLEETFLSMLRTDA
jgi:ABC-2 type transport system ATP-binding protein